MTTYVTPKRRRMIAPQYMQPRKPVLDEPLEAESKQRTFAVPSPVTVQRAVLTPEFDQVSAPTTAAESVNATDGGASSPVYYAELAGVQSVADQPAQFVAEAVDAAESPAVESEQAPTRKRRKLSIFQQLIVILLEIVVVMILATVYLYITGRIDLPPVVVDGIEKGLSLLPFLQ